MKRLPLILTEDHAWVLAPDPDGARELGPEDLDPAALAARCAEAISDLGGAHVEILLPWWRCTAARIECPLSASRPSDEELGYVFEESVPAAADELWLDFIGSQSSRLGVGVEAAWIAPLCAALSDHGITVDRVVPATLCTLQHAMDKRDLSPRLAIVERSVGALETVELDRGEPGQWLVGDADDTPWIRSRIEALPADASIWIESSPELAGRVGRIAADHGVASAPFPSEPREPIRPWIDLRRGDPARRAKAGAGTRRIAVAITAAALAASVVHVAAAFDHQAETRRHVAEQERSYRQVVVTGPIPVGIRDRLSSLARAGGDDRALSPPDHDAANVFATALATLDGAPDVRVSSFSASYDAMRLEGTAPAFEHVESLIAQIPNHAPPAFTVESPISRSRGSSVEYSIFAQRDAGGNP